MNKIAISGITGFLGSRVADSFRQLGWEIVPLKRSDFSETGTAELASRLEGCSVVIHFAGAPIDRRWTRAYKATLRSSRILTTRALVKAMDKMAVKPALFLCASAVGIYPLQGGPCSESDFSVEKLADSLPTGSGAVSFLSRLCVDWEQEANRSPQPVRVVNLRLGVVLSESGGAFGRMSMPLRLGLGFAAQVGDSAEPFAWVHLEDLLRAVHFITDHPQISGPVNVVAPHHGTQGAFASALTTAFGRRWVVPVPSFVLYLLYGSGASVLTRGREVLPARLLEAGFRFGYADPLLATNALAGKLK